MPPARKKKGPSASPNQLPTGPVLLGELRTALGLSFSKVARTTHRLEAGETVDEEAVTQLSLAIGQVLVTSEVVPGRPQIAEPELLIAIAIHFLVRKWDHATMELRAGEPLRLDQRVMTLAGAQLFAIDIAILVGAWIALLGIDPQRLASVAAPTIAVTMADALKGTGLTQGKLCKKLRVPASTVRRWARGSRPRDSTLVAVAALMKGPPSLTTAIGDLRRRIICAAVLERLGSSLPVEDTDDLWQAFIRLARTTALFLSHLPDLERLALCRVVFVEGVDGGGAEQLLEHLVQSETDQRWRPPIQSTLAWARRLVFARGIAYVVAGTATSFKEALGPSYKLLIDSYLAESTFDMERLAEAMSHRRPEFEASIQGAADEFRGVVARRQGRVADAALHFGAAANRVHADRDARVRHAYALAESGNLQEALALASKEDDAFDATLLKAMLLISSGELEEGRLELERAAAASEPTAELLLYLGVARWRCRDFRGALNALERSIASKNFTPHPKAIDIAAECAFEIGNTKKGKALARLANRGGEPRTYLDWRMGKFATTRGRP